MMPLEELARHRQVLEAGPTAAREALPGLFAVPETVPPKPVARGSGIGPFVVQERLSTEGRPLTARVRDASGADLLLKEAEAAAVDARRLLLADLARLTPPPEDDALAPPLGVCVHEGRLFVVRRFVPGRPLSRILDILRDEDVPPDAPTWRLAAGARGGGANVTGAKVVCRIGLFAARALAELHRRGVVHGAVTPANLICDDTVRPTLVDASVGRAPPPHVAPEVVAGAPGSPASDLWSLGVVLHRCLTRGPLFGKRVPDEPEALARAVGRRTPVRPLKLNFKASKEMDTLTLWLLERDPSDRPPSAAELVEELERYHRNEPIRRRPPSLLRRLLG